MPIFRKKQNFQEKYTLLGNSILHDPTLSARAKGIWAFLMSLPVDRKISLEELKKYFTDDIESIKIAVNELIDRRIATNEDDVIDFLGGNEND